MVKKKKEEQRIRKPFISAGISLIVMIILAFISVLLGEKGSIIILSFISASFLICTLLVFVGFYYIGKRYKSEFLRRVVIAGFVLFVAIALIASNVPESYEQRISGLNSTLFVREANLNQLVLENASEEVLISFEEETEEYILKEGIPLILPVLIIFLVVAIYLTLFGIGMIKLKEVKKAKWVGVLSIIVGWLMPTIIGIFLALPIGIVLHIMAIFMFFEESRKAKE